MFDPERAGARGGLYGSSLPGGTATAPGGSTSPPFTELPLPPGLPPPVIPRPGAGGRGARNAGNRQPGNRPTAGRGELYGGYTVAQLTANPALVNRLGAPAAAKWRARGAGAPTTPPAAAPPSTPPASPTPGAPVGGSGGGAGGPSVPGMSGPGSPYVPTPGAPNTPGPFYNEFTDPFAMFFSAIPAMRMNTTRQIGDAVAQAGFTGNRWGTSTQNTVGQIGAEAAARENAMLQGMMADFANNQENRALGASGYAVGVGNALEEAARNRVTVPFGVGAYEQGRQDDIQRLLFQDWAQNRLGWLGPALDFAGRQGAGSPGSPGQIIQVPGEPAKPGAIDWARVLAEFFG